ncbi:MAG: DUF4132 domain-containing protein [Actinoplanes sp.]
MSDFEVDEDTFVFPAGWHRHRYARRGSSGAGPFVPDPKARAIVQEEIQRRPGSVGRALEAPTTPADIRAAGNAWRAGDPSAPPIGAAAVAAGLRNWNTHDKLVAFADVWIAERGIRFAAEAAVHLMSLQFCDDNAPAGPHYTGKDHYGVRPMRAGEIRHGWHADLPMQVLLRVRQALAAAPDDDYAATVALLTPFRAGHAYARVATSVLVPAQADWVEQDVAAAIADADPYRAAVLTAAISTGEQSDGLAALATGWTVFGSMAALTTLVDGVGPAAAPALFRWFDQDAGDAESQRRLLTVLAALPGDEVMGGLVDRLDVKFVAPALLEAAERFPARALRMLAEAGAKRSAADLLRAHLMTHLDLIEQVRPQLSPAAAARIDELAGDAAAIVVAPLSAVPPLLADPPWNHRVKAAKPVVVAGLTCTDPPTVSWLPGERETWRQTPITRFPDRKESWEKIAQRLLAGRQQWNEPGQFFTEAPLALAASVLVNWQPRYAWEAGTWMRLVVDRFEADALPAALHLAQRSPGEVAPILLPLASPELAVVMADWLARLKSVRQFALTWLLRHATAAARALVPPALGKAGPARRQAEQALLALHTNGHTAAVRAAGESYGAEAAAAIGTLLDTDPLSVLPAKMPPVPAWAGAALLPPVLLRDGSGALPAEAIGNLVTMLAISKLDDPYAGLAVVRQACEPAGLAEFGWGLFQRWQSSGAPSKENWALSALALIGDDETVRRLTPLILAWPGEGGHAKAVTGVDILAAIGSDVALMRLHGISQRAKFKGLKTAAQQKMEEVAAGLGLSAEQLADRLVPDFGLAADGSLRLDYGPRQFVVGFDEQLRPYVADADGKQLKALPKPGVRDDAELATAAYKQFSALKKDVRTIAADQVRRLERAMVTGRRWSTDEFQQLFVDHPLLWHIVRRLVWGRYDTAGAFRVAEDRSFSSVDDEAITLPADASIGVAHPLHLGDDLGAWSELFADYEILQPFPQLGRPTYALTAEEAASSRLVRFEGITLPTTKVIGLERRGWRRETPQDAGMQGRMELIVAPGLEVAVDIEPGIVIGMIDEYPEQKIDLVMLHDGSGSRWSTDGRGQVPLSRLDPVVASELLRDLTEMTA